MATNSESIKKDNKIRTQAGKAYFAVEDSGLQLQPLNEDWIELDASLFSYYGSGSVETTSAELTRFQLGDKIRITQNGTEKYFYVRVIDDAVFAVTPALGLGGGDTYTVANDTIDNFYYSRVVNPQGFPSFVEYVPDVTDQSSTTINYNSPGAGSIEYIMVGKQVFFTVNFFNLNVQAGTDEIRFSQPGFYLADYLAVNRQNSRAYIDYNGAGTHIPALAELVPTSEASSGYILLTRPDNSDFPTGNGSALFTLIAKV